MFEFAPQYLSQVAWKIQPTSRESNFVGIYISLWGQRFGNVIPLAGLRWGFPACQYVKLPQPQAQNSQRRLRRSACLGDWHILICSYCQVSVEIVSAARNKLSSSDFIHLSVSLFESNGLSCGGRILLCVPALMHRKRPAPLVFRSRKRQDAQAHLLQRFDKGNFVLPARFSLVVQFVPLRS